MSVKIEFKVPAADRRRKNYTQTGVLFEHPIGGKPVAMVLQDNGDVAHYATGGLILRGNTVKARKLSIYVANPYGRKRSNKEIIQQLLNEIDAERFYRVVEAHPVLNT